MQLQRKNYPGLGDPVGPYVHAVKHGNTLYLSGITAFGTTAQTGEIEEQARAIYQQIQDICETEGCSLSNMIKMTAFVTDLSRMKELHQAMFEIYGGQFPASSLVRVAGLFSDDLKIEIEAVIAIDE